MSKKGQSLMVYMFPHLILVFGIMCIVMSSVISIYNENSRQCATYEKLGYNVEQSGFSGSYVCYIVKDNTKIRVDDFEKLSESDKLYFKR